MDIIISNNFIYNQLIIIPLEILNSLCIRCIKYNGIFLKTEIINKFKISFKL